MRLFQTFLTQFVWVCNFLQRQQATEFIASRLIELKEVHFGKDTYVVLQLYLDFDDIKHILQLQVTFTVPVEDDWFVCKW